MFRRRVAFKAQRFHHVLVLGLGHRLGGLLGKRVVSSLQLAHRYKYFVGLFEDRLSAPLHQFVFLVDFLKTIPNFGHVKQSIVLLYKSLTHVGNFVIAERIPGVLKVPPVLAPMFQIDYPTVFRTALIDALDNSV